ncbi:MAG TPA: alkaline phosphatase family protein [Terriglobales bacterium]|jgi:phospholipase C|nr:alkaline phosphatase family protein [Terriglobales bacterium]
MSLAIRASLWALVAGFCCSAIPRALAEGNLNSVNHIIVIVQENHSYDNYFGALAYAPGSPYSNGNGACSSSNHSCVDGLTCTASGGNLICSNSNIDNEGATVYATHSNTRCITDPDHSWFGEHLDLNWSDPNASLSKPLDNGFERDDEPINGDQVMYYYTQQDLPFYYNLAQNFAISDRHFAGTVGPTFPNRSYLEAATSFGHLTTSDSVPPPGGYKPITGTIYDLLNNANVSWADYFQDVPSDVFFDEVDLVHNQPLDAFYLAAAGITTMPSVVFVDPDLGVEGETLENDEHPPTDIQRGQYFVSQVVNAVRNGPHWKDSIIFITWDEGGGFYDHGLPPRAVQAGQRNPDGIFPGQCEDLSNPPASEQPGGGAECSYNLTDGDTSVEDAEELCPALTKNPTGPYPASCRAFDQLGIRVPFLAISPFSKAKYVSHTVVDHTSILALIEHRFLNSASLTDRDKYANTAEDMFDFTHSPSLNTPVTTAQPPAQDCTPEGGSGAFGQSLRKMLAH